ncbi:hypothetical protein BMS3Abin06_02766 [bacterium BMS3Abin06]|nr:hypothetical protein BMS3Abin06_02766 [bacterium BMS3Abin06]HDZ00274.1 hypothetical protein [Nitrospirota bacterium]
MQRSGLSAGIPLKDLESKMEKYSVTDGVDTLTQAMGMSYNLYLKLSRQAADTKQIQRFCLKRRWSRKPCMHAVYLKEPGVRLAAVYKQTLILRKRQGLILCK